MLTMIATQMRTLGQQRELDFRHRAQAYLTEA